MRVCIVLCTSTVPWLNVYFYRKCMVWISVLVKRNYVTEVFWCVFVRTDPQRSSWIGFPMMLTDKKVFGLLRKDESFTASKGQRGPLGKSCTAVIH